MNIFRTSSSYLHLVFLLAVLSVLVIGCSSEDDEEATFTRAPPILITGTAAAGAPIVGIISVKGANGVTASSPIKSDGAYSINVTALTGPYILFAEGSVNGKSVRYFSSGVVGVINITHITDYIVENATTTPTQLNDVYINWARSQIDAAALTTANDEVVLQLSPLLDAVGVDSLTVDFITTPFRADFTGIDIVLEAIDINYDGYTAIVTNSLTNLTGSQFTNDLTTPDNKDIGLPSTDADIAAITDAVSDQAAINLLFDRLEDLFATGIPSQQEINMFEPFIETDYLENGVDKTNELSRFSNGDGGPQVGVQINAVIESAMDVSTIAYDKGYWIQLHIKQPGFSGVVKSSVVSNGSYWFWYGNQEWINANISAWAEMWTTSGGSVTFYTGFDIGGDALLDEFGYAYQQGVRSGIIKGYGLPADGLIIEHKNPENYFEFFSGNPVNYWMTDAAILSIPDNSTYEINLYSETAEELTVIVYTPTSLETISYTLMKRPYTNAELSSGLFPVLILPNSHDLADLANSISLGFLDVTWQNSATADVSYLGLLWWDGSGQQEIGSLILPGITSHRFDSSTGYLAPVDWGILGLFGEDHYDRVLAHVWQFSE